MNTQKSIAQCHTCRQSLTADSAISLYQGRVYCQSCQRPHPPVALIAQKAILAAQQRATALLKRA